MPSIMPLVTQTLYHMHAHCTSITAVHRQFFVYFYIFLTLSKLYCAFLSDSRDSVPQLHHFLIQFLHNLCAVSYTHLCVTPFFSSNPDNFFTLHHFPVQIPNAPVHNARPYTCLLYTSGWACTTAPTSGRFW